MKYRSGRLEAIWFQDRVLHFSELFVSIRSLSAVGFSDNGPASPMLSEGGSIRGFEITVPPIRGSVFMCTQKLI
jgi:hypothetical protein